MQEQHTCKNCGNTFSGKYCNQCGEKVYTAHDKSIPHFFEDAVHFITHFEGTFFTTVKAMATRPGQWSKDYCEGKRKPYFRPLSFFMLLVILYLLFPLYTGLNMPFAYHLNESAVARSLVSKKVKLNLDSLQQQVDSAVDSRQFGNDDQAFFYRVRYADSLYRMKPEFKRLESAYNKSAEKTSKLLLLLMIPLSAGLLWLVQFRRRFLLFDHLVLATELNAFNILFSFLLLPLVLGFLVKLMPANWGNYLTDFTVTLFSYCMLGIYTARALKVFYAESWYAGPLKSLFFILGYWFIVLKSYKIILFVVTFYLSA